MLWSVVVLTEVGADNFFAPGYMVDKRSFCCVYPDSLLTLFAFFSIFCKMNTDSVLMELLESKNRALNIL